MRGIGLQVSKLERNNINEHGDMLLSYNVNSDCVYYKSDNLQICNWFPISNMNCNVRIDNLCRQPIPCNMAYMIGLSFFWIQLKCFFRDFFVFIVTLFFESFFEGFHVNTLESWLKSTSESKRNSVREDVSIIKENNQGFFFMLIKFHW